MAAFRLQQALAALSSKAKMNEILETGITQLRFFVEVGTAVAEVGGPKFDSHPFNDLEPERLAERSCGGRRRNSASHIRGVLPFP